MRTIQEIYDQMAAEKAEMAQLRGWITNQDNPNSVLDDSQTLLQDLTSSSKVAIWRLFMWLMAFAVWIHEGLWGQFRKEVDEKLAAEQPHTQHWYRTESLKFQYGDDLVWQDNKFQYLEYDPLKQIIKHAATNEGKGKVVIKVATEKNGILQKLETNQLAAFTAFWEKHRDAGVQVRIISVDPDLLKLKYKIHYDPLVMLPDGTLINDSSLTPVQTAINDYLNSVEFDGNFILSKLEDAIQDATGVIDFERIETASKYGTNSYQEITRLVNAYAGWFIIDPEFKLDDTIEYVANV
jgi:hypothetical protein